MRVTVRVCGALLALILIPGAAHAIEAYPVNGTVQEQLDWLRRNQEEFLQVLQETQARQKTAAQGEKVKFSGYIQAEALHDETASVETNFRVRRARLKVDAPVSDLASLTLQIDATTSVELRDAHVDLSLGGGSWKVRAGQGKVPFMYDVLQSSSVRLTPERTEMTRRLFPGERDLGAWAQVGLGGGTTVDVGVMSGNGPNKSDNNDEKDFVGRVRFPLGGGTVDKDTEANSIYLGFLTGEFTDSAGMTTDRTRVGGGVSLRRGPLWFRGEYLTGEDRGMDFSGWYGQAAYAMANSPVTTFFVRYEQFDEDDDTPNTDYRAFTVGVERQMDSKTRLVLAHEFRDPDAGFSAFSSRDGGLTTLRIQVKY